MGESDLTTVRELRRKWKPHKRYMGQHPNTIRFHRACSWLDESQKLDREDQSDIVLIQQWIAFNALYGVWDEDSREPCADRASWKAFLARVLNLDQSNHISNVLTEHRKLVLAILANEHLNKHFWQDFGETSNGNGRFAHADKRAQTWYVEKRWLCIVETLLDRIYLLRCQLVHGAATCGGKLNRTPLKHCTRMLELLLPAILMVWIDHGPREDWGAMCYPPTTGIQK